MVISNGEWNMESYIKYKQWETESIAKDIDINTLPRDERMALYKLIVSWCNSTEYEEWASHTFGIKDEQLPLMLLYTPREDGYWIYEQNGNKDMKGWLDDVFNDKLEIIYTRNWIARQAIKLERWMNSLSSLAVGCVFVGVFVCLCGIMVALDYFCSPAEPLKTD